MGCRTKPKPAPPGAGRQCGRQLPGSGTTPTHLKPGVTQELHQVLQFRWHDALRARAAGNSGTLTQLCQASPCGSAGSAWSGQQLTQQSWGVGWKLEVLSYGYAHGSWQSQLKCSPQAPVQVQDALQARSNRGFGGEQGCGVPWHEGNRMQSWVSDLAAGCMRVRGWSQRGQARRASWLPMLHVSAAGVCLQRCRRCCCRTVMPCHLEAAQSTSLASNKSRNSIATIIYSAAAPMGQPSLQSTTPKPEAGWAPRALSLLLFPGVVMT